MAFFQLLAGIHICSCPNTLREITYQRGEVVESATNLETKFGSEKFRECRGPASKGVARDTVASIAKTNTLPTPLLSPEKREGDTGSGVVITTIPPKFEPLPEVKLEAPKTELREPLDIPPLGVPHTPQAELPPTPAQVASAKEAAPKEPRNLEKDYGPLISLSTKELLAVAEAEEIEVGSKKSKDELIKILREFKG